MEDGEPKLAKSGPSRDNGVAFGNANPRRTHEDAEEACQVLRRSIVELCDLDHKGDTNALDLWLSNKTPRNLRRWITENHVFVAAEDGVILGVSAVDNSAKSP
jgi:hypothetical protein